jgi:hypothetical protein
VPEPRPYLLKAVLAFVRVARSTPGVLRIALIGSLATDKPVPKDADVLVTIDAAIDLDPLARLGRRLQGAAQTINLGADIFLADVAGGYLGRICHYRECFPRIACRALSCGLRQHLKDDLQVVTLSPTLVIRAASGLRSGFQQRAPCRECSAEIGGSPDAICSCRALPLMTQTGPRHPRADCDAAISTLVDFLPCRRCLQQAFS